MRKPPSSLPQLREQPTSDLLGYGLRASANFDRISQIETSSSISIPPHHRGWGVIKMGGLKSKKVAPTEHSRRAADLRQLRRRGSPGAAPEAGGRGGIVPRRSRPGPLSGLSRNATVQPP